MARDTDLKLNSLDRYRKNSPGLILEEHSHCEVPAGCGGVVFRWIDPRDALPVLVRFDLASTGSVQNPNATLTLDGAALKSSRAMVHHGLHCFALSFECPVGATLLFSAHSDDAARSRPLAAPFALDSDADGRWRVSTAPRATDDWRHPGFDDALWTPLRSAPTPAAASAPYHIQRILKHGARMLAIPRASTVYVRCRFELALSESP